MMRGLYAITPDLADTAKLLRRVEPALAGGTAILQYRNKLADSLLAFEQAEALRALTRRYGACFIINDNLELALQTDADGVHLGSDDGDLAQARAWLPRGRLLGASCYDDLTLARAALANGADYVAFGAVFASGTKPLARRASPELIRSARAEFSAPIVAIGGITQTNAHEVVSAGADCIAVIAALFESEDIENTARNFSSIFK